MIVIFLEDDSEEIPPGLTNNFEVYVLQKSTLSGTINSLLLLPSLLFHISGKQ
jgi:hypothetical protein